MVNSNNSTLLLDSDVLVNWLALEEDIVTHAKLWEAPHKIMSMIESGAINGSSTLINIMEIRFVLRAKKKFSENKINAALNKITGILKLTIPDEINLLKSNEIQIQYPPLSAIDAILLAVAIAMDNAILITRDRELLKSAAKFVPVLTPEEFLKSKR